MKSGVQISIERISQIQIPVGGRIPLRLPSFVSATRKSQSSEAAVEPGEVAPEEALSLSADTIQAGV